MFRQYTTRVSATPGHIASRGAISMYCRPSRLSIVPQLGTSGGSPKPRKLNDASAMIAHPIVDMAVAERTVDGRCGTPMAGSRGPCHVAALASGELVFAANYSGGALSMFRCAGGDLTERLATIAHEGSSFNRSPSADH